MTNKPTVLLIDPPYYRLFKETYGLARYPLSLGYLAGTIKKETDWKVVVYNADFLPEIEPVKVGYLTGEGFKNYLRNLEDPSGNIWQRIAGIIADYRPAVVGISCKSQTYSSAVRVAKIVKDINPKSMVVAGGPHPSMVGKEILKDPAWDVAVRGEGEAVILRILDAVKNGKSLEGIPGIDFRNQGTIVENGPGEFISDLNSLSFPYEYAPEVLHDYPLYPATAFNRIFATRGCPYHCFFCGSRNVWGRKVRFRSVENVLQEIKGLWANGITTIHFDDDTFGINTPYIQSLCQALETQCPGLQWSCELHVKLVNAEHLARMKKAGCFFIQLGIESGNNDILTVIRKGFTIEEALTAARTIVGYGIGLQAFFMVGFPQETEETLNDTLWAMKQIHGRLSYSIFTPYPGTEAFEFCRNHGLIGDQFNPSLYNHQSPENCFCLHISRERFRYLVSRIERMVDRVNYPNVVRRMLRKLNPFKAIG